MADTKFTPGPWRCEPGNRGRSEHHNVWCGDGAGCICIVYSGLEPSHSSEANSRLIAAAPDLYAACEAVEAWRDGEVSSVAQCLSWLDETIVVVRAALAKARGEAQS